MFATYAGGYSRGPLPAQPDVVADAERAFAEGRLDAEGLRAVRDALVAEVVREMEVVGLGIAGDGGVRRPDRIVPLIDGLAGLRSGGETRLPDGERVTRPLVTGPVAWREPITVADWAFVNRETELFAKQVLVGPYTLAVLAEPVPGRDRARLAVDLAEALNAELQALSAAGCPMVEIDEPLALRIGDDAREWRAFAAAHRRLTTGYGGLADEGITHLSLGLWGGQIDRAGYPALLELPYLSYLVDVLAGPSAWRFVAAVPADRGIVAGAVDASSTSLEETEQLVWAMAWAAQAGRGQARVGVAPNGSLALVDRHFSHRKAQRCGEAIVVANAGPLEEVAVALVEDPGRSWMPGLRAMAAAVDAGRR